MVFKCQEDSFLKQFVTKVVSCDPSALDWTPPGDVEPKRLHGFNVICENTILFPEGGGQPCDFGTINGHPVRNVTRNGSDAVHFVETPERFEEGAEVKQCVEWERRLDHMQQHSGQHMITALFETEFNYNTTSWWLGSDTSYIELETTHLISRESLDLIEQKANDLIRQGKTVTVMMVDPEEELQTPNARPTRGLPKDHVGLARLICIQDVDTNMCCGTHVSNLSQLQCVKLLYAEKSKGKVLVHFVVGERVMRKLGECFQREQQMNLVLKGGPAEHLDLIQKLQNNLKAATKAFQKLIKEIAISEADKLENMPAPRPKYHCLHRRDGNEPDFINTFLRTAPEDIFYFLTVSDNDGKGRMVLRGEPALVQKFGPIFLELLDGKGNGKANNFQGKINCVKKIPECEAILVEHFEPKKPAAQAS